MIKEISYILCIVALFSVTITTIMRNKKNDEPWYVWRFVLPIIGGMIFAIILSVFDLYHFHGSIRTPLSIIAAGWTILYYFIYYHFSLFYNILENVRRKDRYNLIFTLLLILSILVSNLVKVHCLIIFKLIDLISLSFIVHIFIVTPTRNRILYILMFSGIIIEKILYLWALITLNQDITYQNQMLGVINSIGSLSAAISLSIVSFKNVKEMRSERHGL